MSTKFLSVSEFSYAIAALSALLTGPTAMANPQIDAVTGSLIHGGQLQITGTNFGAKEKAGPVVWDTCQELGTISKWDGAWPDNSQDPNHDTKCREPFGSVLPPHDHTSAYIAGSHAETAGYNAGYNVFVFKNRNIRSGNNFTYLNYYQIVDPNWTFCDDNNFKVFDYSQGTSPYSQNSNWYVEYNPRPTSTTSGLAYHLNNNTPEANGLQTTDNNGLGHWRGAAENPMAGEWIKVEMEMNYVPDSTGFIRIWEDGVLRVNYEGRTDNLGGTARSEGIGGYARCSGPNNWRYFADVYMDYSLARVVIANSQNLEDATVIEPQIPLSWASDSIDITVNLGKIKEPKSAFVFVVDSEGRLNSIGFPLSIRPKPPVLMN